MYRNYDGNKSTFGDTSISATGPNPDNVAVFAAQRSSDNALTVMVIAKYLSGTTPVSISLANFTPSGTAQVYQLTSANAINRLTDLNFSGSTVSFTAPAQSITLLVLPKSGATNQPPVAVASASPTSGAAPLAVAFSSAGSNDPDGSIVSYGWTFGDGGTSTSASPVHTYTTPGAFTAALTVTDNLGATGTASVGVTVTGTVNAPTTLTASGSKSTVTLKWTDNSTNESGFYIERAPSGGSFTRIATTGPNVITYKNNPGRGTFSYRVQAFWGTAVSAYTNTVTISVK
jgi:PKD repeat protein